MPTGTARCSSDSILRARRWASGTPRRRMPMNASRSRSEFFSRISCASRTSVRSISEALMSWPLVRVRGMGVVRNSVAWRTARQNAIEEQAKGVREMLGKDDFAVHECKYSHREEPAWANWVYTNANERYNDSHGCEGKCDGLHIPLNDEEGKYNHAYARF